MQFATPHALLLLLILPFFIWLGWPSRGAARRREALSLSLRIAILVLLIFALAGTELLSGGDNLAVVFLVDYSDSMPNQAKADAFSYVREAIRSQGPDDQAAVILFGGDALVERPMSSSKSLDAFSSLPDTTQTDLAAAIRLGMAMYPPGAARRMVLLSDGAQTRGDLLETARLAGAAGVEIIAVPYVFASDTETVLLDVDAPERLIAGETFDLKVTVRATEPTAAGIRVLDGGQPIYEGSIELDRGVQSFSIPLRSGDPGFANYSVQIVPAVDSYYQNNELAAYSQVAGPPKILLVAPPEGEALPVSGEFRPDEYSHLASALSAAGFDVSTVRPTGLPFELTALTSFGSIILVDVPARELSIRQMRALQTYVRDLGGGLVAVGGPTSYGVGGYFRTPLEETLPVDMEIKDEARRPSLTMLFIIDRSGSMSATSGGVSKLELAVEAVSRSIELLFPSDRVGVIAFDSEAQWVVPIGDLSQPQDLLAAVGSLRSGGGTDILAGLQAMSRELPNDPARLKHVILLTDGGADPTGIPELVEQMLTQHGITLSTVGIGTDAAPFLADLARVGGGRYHLTENPAAIPSIFTEETTLATRAYIIEETFFPEQASNSPLLAGIDAIPPLHGYIGTTGKQTAQTILASQLGDPILATWQYGLGKSVAFTSDATARWARDWVAWSGYATFWGQVVRSTINENVQSGLSARVEQSSSGSRLVVEAQTQTGLYLNDYQVSANLIAPGGEVQSLDLQQTAPGRYSAPIQAQQQGAYLIRVDALSPGGQETITTVQGWVFTYSPEYRNLGSDPDELVRVVAQVNGRITSGEPSEAFAHTLPAPADRRPIWPWLLLAAALLLPWDIGVRRLAIGGADIRRGLERVFSGLRLSPAGAPPAPRSARMSTLLQAKGRAQRSAEAAPPLITTREHRQDVPVVKPLAGMSIANQVGAAAEGASPTRHDQSAPAQPEEAGKPASEAQRAAATVEERPDLAGTTSALLAGKRARERRRRESQADD